MPRIRSLTAVFTAIIVAVLTFTLTYAEGDAPAAAPGPAAKPDSIRERASYALGLNVAQLIIQQGFDVDPAFVARGVQDALSEQAPALSDDELNEAVRAYQMELQKARMAAAETNKKAAEEYFAQNAGKEGVVTTESGLQYEVLKAGEGASPSEANVVKTHYRGTLLDGTEFDSSYKRNEPTEFQLGGVIQGWQEALKLMKPGAKWRIYVPSELAYGMRGSGRKIGPNAALIFEIELISVEEAPAQPPQMPPQ